MKKLIYVAVAIMLLGTLLSSCAVDKKCPAYSKADIQTIEKTV